MWQRPRSPNRHLLRVPGLDEPELEPGPHPFRSLARQLDNPGDPQLHPRRTGVPLGRLSQHGPPGHRASFVPSSAIDIFLGGEVASNWSFGSSPEGTADVPVHDLRAIGPSRLPRDPAQLGVPGHRTGLSISRRVHPAARKVTKLATLPHYWNRLKASTETWLAVRLKLAGERGSAGKGR